MAITIETAVDCVGTLYPDLFQDKIAKRAHRGSLRDCLRCLVPTPSADSFLEDLSVLLPSLLSHYKMAVQPIAAGYSLLPHLFTVQSQDKHAYSQYPIHYDLNVPQVIHQATKVASRS